MITKKTLRAYFENNHTLEKVDKLRDFIINNKICSEESVCILTGINGYSEEVLNSLLYYQLGYRNIEQLWDCCRNEFDFSMFEF